MEAEIDPMPCEIAEAVRFDEDLEVRGFDHGVALAYWRTLVEVHRVFQLFRTRFVGKVSPIHLFWGASISRSRGSPGARRRAIPAEHRS